VEIIVEEIKTVWEMFFSLISPFWLIASKCTRQIRIALAKVDQWVDISTCQ
jgi:hypothetical protein